MTEVMVYPDPTSGPWMLSFHVGNASNLLDDTRPHILILLEHINSDGTQTHLHIGKFPGLYAKFRNDAYFDLQVWIDDNPHLKVELPDTDLFIDLCEKINEWLLSKSTYIASVST